MTYNFAMLAGVAFVLTRIPEGVDKQEALQVVRVLAWSIGSGLGYFIIESFFGSWGVNNEVIPRESPNRVDDELVPPDSPHRIRREFLRTVISIEFLAFLTGVACTVFFLIGGVLFINVLLSIA